MSRRRRAVKREVLADPKFESQLVTVFISQVMRRGKRSTAQRIVYGALETINDKIDGDPVEIFQRAIDNVRPQLEVKSRRVGGATYQVPMELSASRSRSLAMRWVIAASKGRRGVPMSKALGTELIDAYNNSGSCVKKRDDTHKMAQANRAFAHYRW